jgi:hypothetical protein
LLNGDCVCDDTLAFFVQRLSGSEANRYNSFLRHERRRQFLLGRILLRLAVSHLTGLPADGLDIRERPGNAPLLVLPDAQQASPGFSISHSRNWVACLVSCDVAVAIDIEVHESARDINAISELVFHPSEHHWLLALSRAERKDVEMLYWTAASWGAAISLGLDQPELAVDFPVVRALTDRALALDETWSKGALHELMISLDSLPEALGGDPKRARQHFDRAVALQKGQAPGPYVALVTGVSVPERNRAEFESLLKQAIAVDPNADPSVRLATLITQRRARALLDQVDTRFVQ